MEGPVAFRVSQSKLCCGPSVQDLKLEVQTPFIHKLGPVPLSLTFQRCSPVQKEECSPSLQYSLTFMGLMNGLDHGNGLLGHDYINLRELIAGSNC